MKTFGILLIFGIVNCAKVKEALKFSSGTLEGNSHPILASKANSDTLEEDSKPISNSEALRRISDEEKKCMGHFITNLSQLSSATSKLLASVDHENNDVHRSKRYTTEKSKSKDPETKDTSSIIHLNDTNLDIRRPSHSVMNCKNSMQWIFQRLFDTIVETKVRFLLLPKNSYVDKCIIWHRTHIKKGLKLYVNFL